LISIGNDIVALQCTDPERTKEERFFSKILCNEELSRFNHNIFSALSFTNFVWLGWSIKESIYKFRKRHDPDLMFSPTKIVIQKIDSPVRKNGPDIFYMYEGVSFYTDECYCCEVCLDSQMFYTRTLVNSELIFTVAGDTTCFDNIYWGIKNIGNDAYVQQSRAVRELSLRKLNTFFPDIHLSIEKSKAGHPVLTQQKNIPISFTHHGNHVGYAFELNEMAL
jgi:phosphopantetheinyl transferase (holo-ACP synthase)